MNKPHVGVIGQLDWQIVSPRSGEEPRSGRRTLEFADLRIQGPWWPSTDPPKPRWIVSMLDTIGVAPTTRLGKSVPLDDELSLFISTVPTTSEREIRGMFMSLRRGEESIGTSKVFLIDRPGHARFPPGDELAVLIGPTASRWDIARTEFLTDASFDVPTPQEAGMMARALSSWTSTQRVTIRSGSSIDWLPTAIRDAETTPSN